jgi:DNA repair protein RadD
MIWIDEAHLVSQNENSQYLSFLAIMKLINPHVKIVGMSATLYRMGQGHLTDNGLFTDVCYDLTSMEGFNKLLNEGYLCPLIPFTTKTRLDVSDVGIQNGEFVSTQLQGAVDKAEITFNALKEICHAGKDRKSWLIFSSGIDHAEHIAEQLGAFGVDCAPVHSKRPADYNEKALSAFRNYELKSIVSFSKITTGFDHPGVDLIGDLRPTISIPLHVQKYGRGMRPVYGEGHDLSSIEGRLAAIKNGPKPNCVCLDFSRNTPRLGPVNDPRLPTKRGNKEGEVPIKICEMCGAYNHISARTCCNCAAEFSFAVKIVSKAGSDELIKAAASEPVPIIEQFNVLGSHYEKHPGKFDKPPTLKVTYYTTGLQFKEFVCLEHNGMAGKVARDWWRKRHKTEPPSTIDEALKFVSELRCPRFIRVHVNKKYPEILGVEF